MLVHASHIAHERSQHILTKAKQESLGWDMTIELIDLVLQLGICQRDATVSYDRSIVFKFL